MTLDSNSDCIHGFNFVLWIIFWQRACLCRESQDALVLTNLRLTLERKIWKMKSISHILFTWKDLTYPYYLRKCSSLWCNILSFNWMVMSWSPGILYTAWIPYFRQNSSGYCTSIVTESLVFLSLYLSNSSNKMAIILIYA